MADNTAIEWADATWNPITGCSVLSPGCAHCYAMRLAGGRLRNDPSRAGLTQDSAAGPVWTGEVRLNAHWLDQPLRWRRPRRIFVCAHGDLFHESVPDEWIDQVFAVMAVAPQHTFLVLTKRASRMRAYLSSHDVGARWAAIGFDRCGDIIETPAGIVEWTRHGLLNVWLGVSVEDQRRADERIPELLATPAAVRFISAEPLLGPIILRGEPCETDGVDWLRGMDGCWPSIPPLDWVIAGGESGPDARPMHPDWARSLRDQCTAAGVPFFFKQWGEWIPEDQFAYCDAYSGVDFGDRRWRHSDELGDVSIGSCEWPGAYARVGKRAAGRVLDGRIWDEFPHD